MAVRKGGDGEDSIPDTGDDGTNKPDYDVGYKKPPPDTRWTSDHQPKKRGSRKGVPNFKSALIKFLVEKVWITTKDGSRIRMARYEAVFHKLYEQSTSSKSQTGALRLADLMLRDLGGMAEPINPDVLSSEDEAILADYLRRASAETAAEEPVGQTNQTAAGPDKDTSNVEA